MMETFPQEQAWAQVHHFVVGLLNVLNNFFNKKVSKNYLAEQSIYLEQKILKEVVGSQDQIASSFGGFNEIEFKTNGKYKLKPLLVKKNDLESLEKKINISICGC